MNVEVESWRRGGAQERHEKTTPGRILCLFINQYRSYIHKRLYIFQ